MSTQELPVLLVIVARPLLIRMFGCVPSDILDVVGVTVGRRLLDFRKPPPVLSTTKQYNKPDCSFLGLSVSASTTLHHHLNPHNGQTGAPFLIWTLLEQLCHPYLQGREKETGRVESWGSQS